MCCVKWREYVFVTCRMSATFSSFCATHSLHFEKHIPWFFAQQIPWSTSRLWVNPLLCVENDGNVLCEKSRDAFSKCKVQGMCCVTWRIMFLSRAECLRHSLHSAHAFPSFWWAHPLVFRSTNFLIFSQHIPWPMPRLWVKSFSVMWLPCEREIMQQTLPNILNVEFKKRKFLMCRTRSTKSINIGLTENEPHMVRKLPFTGFYLQ